MRSLQRRRSTPSLYIVALAVLFLGFAASLTSQAGSYSQVVKRTSPKAVKIYGAGGFRGLEAYQSGFLISQDGYILTVWSYVLDTNYITVVLGDGRRFEQAQLVGFDPRLELAVLKIEANSLPHFDLEQSAEPSPGTRILAFSNLYGVATGSEPASVQHGVVSVRTRLEARRGVFETPYRGDVYVLDAITNNPGAAGGALTTRAGRLVGMLGKELRNSMTNTWMNYAVPAVEVQQTVNDIIQGIHIPESLDAPEKRPEFAHSAELLGLVMVPDIMQRTPPFVDDVRRASPAARAGLQRNDLVLSVEGRLIQNCKTLVSELGRLDQADPVRLTVLRNQQLVDVELSLRPGEGE